MADLPCGDLPAVTNGKVADWQTYVDRQAEHHTGRTDRPSRSGRLPDIAGFGPGAAIALARTDGSVTNWQPDFDAARLASNKLR